MHYIALQKQWFPTFLLKLPHEMDNRSELTLTGFKTIGIHPVSGDRVVNKLTKKGVLSAYDLISQTVVNNLYELR